MMKIISAIKKISKLVRLAFLACFIISIIHAIQFHKFDLLIETFVCFHIIDFFYHKKKVMTTSEFIKMLQQEDPSGNAHLRFYDGTPWVVELKAGYWDGPFSYLDEQENYVTSTRGHKLDITCMSLETFVECNFRLHDENNWEKVKSKLKFDFDGYNLDSVKQKEQEKIDLAKKYWDENFEMQKKMFDDSLQEMIFNAGKGWRWFQNKLVEDEDKGHNYFYYNWIVVDEKGKENSSNKHMTEPVIFSGLWERFDSTEKPDYFEWKLNLDKLSH